MKKSRTYVVRGYVDQDRYPSMSYFYFECDSEKEAEKRLRMDMNLYPNEYKNYSEIRLTKYDRTKSSRRPL
jgi:hypothetical protein